MKTEIEIHNHNSVGPLYDFFDHGPVIFIQHVVERGEDEPGNGMRIEDSVFVCLDCGYTGMERRDLAHADCEREKNPVNQTLREKIGDAIDGEQS